MAFGRERGIPFTKTVSLISVNIQFYNFILCALPLKTLILLGFFVFSYGRAGNAESPDNYATEKVSQTSETLAQDSYLKVQNARQRTFERLWKRRAKTESASVESKGKQPFAKNEVPFSPSSKNQLAGRNPVSTRNSGTVEKARDGISQSRNQTIKLSKRSSQASVRKKMRTATRTKAKTVKTAARAGKTTIKTSVKGEPTKKVAKASAKAAKKTLQRSRSAAKATIRATRAAIKRTITAIRLLVIATKNLITLLIAGGWTSVVIIVVVVFVGALVLIMGDRSAVESSAPISAEVQAYDPLIRQYAQQHGMLDYVDLIKAVMMQESGGRGSDPMQAAECVFNTRYPNVPNGISDPEYSVDVGIQNLASCLADARAENPIDMERVHLALQGYNFGNGYISWAVRNYGGYSLINAVEFATLQAERLGRTSYGDSRYVPHVIRYYPYGKSAATEATMLVNVALSQEGYVGGAKYWKWYGFESYEAWCACFVSWCADQCGYIEAGTFPRFANCQREGVPWFKERDQWEEPGYIPKKGDLIFFDFRDNEDSDHVGIVDYVENGRIYTIEGNMGNSVMRRSYDVDSESVYGFGVVRL